MVKSALALSLLGLSAVNALPTKPVEERQTWIIGGGGSSFGSGSGDCQIGDPSNPLQSGSCVFTPITGGFNPPRLLKGRDANESKELLKKLEQDLVKLQNKKNKTSADKQKIEELQKAIKHLAGIISIGAPDGGSVTFTPGKRDSISFGPIGGALEGGCPKDVSGVQKALLKLLSTKKPSVTEFLAIERLTHILAACGYSISDDGVTIVKIGKRAATNGGNAEIIAGLQEAYAEALQALSGAEPSFATWLVLESVADQLEFYGVTVDRTAGFAGGSSVTLTPRQEFRLGCLGTDVLALSVFWNALSSRFGRDASKWPRDIFWHYYSVLEALRSCGIEVGELTPQPTVPGGAITPDPTVPGGPLKPDPTVPGGALKPDPTVPGGSFKIGRRESEEDGNVLLAALEALEEAYGTDPAKVPAAIRPTMDTIVADLRGGGVVVIGWPTTTFGISP